MTDSNQNHVYRVEKFGAPRAAHEEDPDRVRRAHQLLRAQPVFVRPLDPMPCVYVEISLPHTRGGTRAPRRP